MNTLNSQFIFYTFCEFILYINTTTIVGDKMKIYTYIKKYFIDILFVFLFLALTAYVLFLGGTAGLSDNGDYERVMIANNLKFTDPVDTQRFVFIDRFYIDLTGNTPREKTTGIFLLSGSVNLYPSIQHLFVKYGIIMNVLYNIFRDGDIHLFRIEFLGLIYCLLYCIALFILFTSIKMNIVGEIIIKGAIIAVACDAGYLTYFNSFYGEAVQIIAVIFLAAFGLKILTGKKQSNIYIILFFINLILFAWSKFANIPLALFAVLAGLFMLKHKNNRICVLAAGGITIGILLFLLTLVPGWMDRQTTYNSVFFGILRNAEEHDAKKYVYELGLPGYTSELADTNYYSNTGKETRNSIKFKNDFNAVSKIDILLFYIRHTGHLIDKLKISALSSSIVRPVYLSNYGHGKPRITFNRKFELWGRLRKKLPYGSLVWNLSLIMLFSIVMFYRAITLRQKSPYFSLKAIYITIIVSAGTIAALFIPIITNGEGDLAKHMFLFIKLMDILTLSIFSIMIGSIFKVIEGKRANLRKHIFLFTLGAALLPAFFLAFNFRQVFLNENIKHTAKMERGSLIEFGRQNGRDILWRVTDINNEEIKIVSNNIVGYGAFCNDITPNKNNHLKYGSNLWMESCIRRWLNSDFIKCFSKKEKSVIKKANNKVLLSNEYLSLKAGGVCEFYFSHVPELADRGYDKAYYGICSDLVYLPDIKIICRAYRDGISIKKDSPYWLKTPYFNNSSMVRIVDKDGYIYMKDAAADNIGIIAAITLDKEAYLKSNP